MQGQHEVQPYVDTAGEHRWRVVVKGTEGSAVEDNIVADSGEGYKDRDECAKAFFGMLFGDWNDSVLAFYNMWHPEMGEVSKDQLLEPNPLVDLTPDEEQPTYAPTVSE